MQGAKIKTPSTARLPGSHLHFHNKPQVCLVSPPAISSLGSRHLPTSSVNDNTQCIWRAKLPQGIWCFRQCYFPFREHALLTGRLQKNRMYFSCESNDCLTKKKTHQNPNKFNQNILFSTFNSAASWNKMFLSKFCFLEREENNLQSFQSAPVFFSVHSNSQESKKANTPCTDCFISPYSF